MLSSDEATNLSRAGFVLEGVGHNVMPSPDRRPQHASPLSNARPTHRNGKAVKWRSKLTKNFSTRIESARAEKMQVIKEDIIIANEVHVFHVHALSFSLHSYHHLRDQIDNTMSGKSVAQQVLKELDWDKLGKAVVSEAGRKELGNLRRAFDDYNNVMKTKFSLVRFGFLGT
ncbi:hypothetical protein L7F22_008302 [Adiantum nelumboides]|nr:hypothetical protein [Adiantum nelumboides]